LHEQFIWSTEKKSLWINKLTTKLPVGKNTDKKNQTLSLEEAAVALAPRRRFQSSSWPRPLLAE
jgi:hypothetical protein